MENKFQQVYEENPEKALVDLGEFLHYSNIGELDNNLNQMFINYYAQMGDNAKSIIDPEIAKSVMFSDENNSETDEQTDNEINSSEITILDSKISVDDFVVTENSVNENQDDFNDELAYLEYMPDPHWQEKDDEYDDDWLF